MLGSAFGAGPTNTRDDRHCRAQGETDHTAAMLSKV
jgi:hypothetical protein